MSAHIVSTAGPRPPTLRGGSRSLSGGRRRGRPKALPVRRAGTTRSCSATRGRRDRYSPRVKIRLSHPDVAQDLVEALNRTDCLAARVAADTVEVLVPWLGNAADARQAATELRFFVRAW